MKISSYKELQAWKFSYRLAKEIYALTANFPKDERFGLVSQLRRASVSVPSNIAEGYYRRSKKEYLGFCRIALGSANEVEVQLSLAKDLKFCDEGLIDVVNQTLQSTLRLLGALCKSLE